MRKLDFEVNYYLTMYGYLHRKITLGNQPRIWTIELTNYCNLDCIMCPRRHMTREIGYMDFDLFRRIINQCKNYIDYIWFDNFGEPLYHPQLPKFINYCSENNISTGFSTNATILDEEKAAMILNSKLDRIYLCLDGTKKEKYESIRLNANFDKTRSNIINFLKLKNKLGKSKPFTNLNMIKMDDTKDEIEDFRKQWEGLADNVYIKPFCQWANQDEEISKKMAKEEREIALQKNKSRYPCIYLWREGIILWNGDLVPCCSDYDGKIVLGNAGREKLKDIWNSSKAREIRKQHCQGSYDNSLCRDCTEWAGFEKDIFYPFSHISKRSISNLFRNFKTPFSKS